MKGCPYCKDFDPIWNTIVHLFKNIQTKKIERLHHPNLIKQFNVGSFPTIILKKETDDFKEMKEKFLYQLF